MEQAAILDHQFVIAAYTVTWVLQLGYLAWLGLKWRAEKRNAQRRQQSLRFACDAGTPVHQRAEDI